MLLIVGVLVSKLGVAAGLPLSPKDDGVDDGVDDWPLNEYRANSGDATSAISNIGRRAAPIGVLST